MGRRLGLIVGVNSYQDTTFRPLHYAETDARALAQWLVNTQGGNWAPADVQHVHGAYATSQLVEALIIEMCVNNAESDDLVFVYFAGHALLDERNGEGYLALANTRYGQPTTALHLPSLAQQAMGRSRAAHVVFLFDCFQTGPIWSMRRSSSYDSKPILGPALLNALQQTNNRLILCSCRGNELAPESGEKNLGTFAYRMIVGLCGPASDQTTKHITLQKLRSYLLNTLGEQHRPQLFGQERTPLILVGDPSTAILLQQDGPSVPQPPQQNGSLPSRQHGQTSPLQSGPLPPAFSPGFPSAPPVPLVSHVQSATMMTTGSLTTQSSGYAPAATATTQMSPMTSGQISPAEEQCNMLLKQARRLIQMQNLGEAFALVEQTLQIIPTHVAALILKGQLLGTLGRFQEAQSVVEQVLQIDPNNALAWSMRAALLTNTGQHQIALKAVERSLELDPSNPETYSIKTSIMTHIAATQDQENSKTLTATKERNGRASFFIGAQLLGLILGIVGAGIPILQPRVPVVVALALQSLALALLCVNAARGSYLHGFVRFLVTLFTSVLAIAILGGVYQFEKDHFIAMVKASPPMMVPILFLGLWLMVAAVVPLLIGLGGFIVGLIVRVRRKKR